MTLTVDAEPKVEGEGEKSFKGKKRDTEYKKCIPLLLFSHTFITKTVSGGNIQQLPIACT
jgi:hypothetical protein